MYPIRTNFDAAWSMREGETEQAPRRVLAKAGTANYHAALTRAERPATARQSLSEAMGAQGQVSVVRLDELEADWQRVDLPHDWRILHRPEPDHPERPDYPRSWQGYYPSGVAYYRKVFAQPLPAPHEHVVLTFDGVSGFSDFWFNGSWLGSQATGYSPVSYDITELMRPEDEGPNIVLVRSDTREAEGWWYEGGGIYRHTWLEIHHDVHIPRHGIHITTPEVTADRARINCAIELANRGPRAAEAELLLECLDPDGAVVARLTSRHLLAPGALEIARLETVLDAPQLWILGDGRVYTARATVTVADAVTHREQQGFGVRTIEWATDGVLVNGQRHKLHGVNAHQDFAGVGVALPDRLIEAKLELFAEMGANAVRTAHHPPTPELVDHADRLGLLLIVENRLLDASPHHLANLRGLVRRFRSHPSVCAWSLENEELDFQGTYQGRALLRRLVAEVKALDATRPTLVGGTVGFEDEYFALVDVAGVHYRSFFRDLDKVLGQLEGRFDGQPAVQDEEGMFVSARGVYQLDREGRRAGALSTFEEDFGGAMSGEANTALEEIGGGSGFSSDIAAQLTEAFTHPGTVGAFLWTGMDYLGEPIPFDWPANVSTFGARDLTGLPKDYYWLLRCLFRPEPLVHAFPHWTWPGKEGERLPFRVYSNCAEVEVLVNGQSVERQPVIDHAARFEDGVVYRPGELTVRGYLDGEAVAEHRQRTAGPAAAVALAADRDALRADGADVVVVRAAVTDTAGTLVPTADLDLSFELVGAGRIIGVGNGDPCSLEPHLADYRRAFNGYAAVIVQAGTETGELRLTVRGDGLRSADYAIPARSDVAAHAVHRAADERLGPAGAHLTQPARNTSPNPQ